MKLEINPETTTSVWELVDAEGNSLVSTAERTGLTIVVHPVFYKGTRVQSLGKITSVGDKGRKQEQLVKVSGLSGKVIVGGLKETMEVIKPRFDKMTGGRN